MDRFITPLLLGEVFPYRAGKETGWLFSKRYDHVNGAARSALNFRGSAKIAVRSVNMMR